MEVKYLYYFGGTEVEKYRFIEESIDTRSGATAPTVVLYDYKRKHKIRTSRTHYYDTEHAAWVAGLAQYENGLASAERHLLEVAQSIEEAKQTIVTIKKKIEETK